MDILTFIILLIAAVGAYLYYKKMNTQSTTIGYSCINNKCSPALGGEFTSMEDCTSNYCQAGTGTKYRCNTKNNQCEISTDGESGNYDDEKKCNDDCSATKGWTVAVHNRDAHGEPVTMHIRTYDTENKLMSDNYVGSGNDITVTVPVDGKMTAQGTIASSHTQTISYKDLVANNWTNVKVSANVHDRHTDISIWGGWS